MGRIGTVNKDRLEIVGGIATAIEYMGLLRHKEPIERALLRYGEDDGLTEEEVREYLHGIKEEAA
jgi:hypothetical protein